MEINSSQEARDQGITPCKYVMVIDLAKCKNARKCVDNCQKSHHLPPNQEFMKIYLMQESEEASPYWMPKPCFHCEIPACVTACPTGATYKREDGIVVIDEEICTGCKYCMSSCPYSSRLLDKSEGLAVNGKAPGTKETDPATNRRVMNKCDFCVELVVDGNLPQCVSSCPNGVIYFGDRNKNLVSNGRESLQFTGLIETRSGFQHMEELGTKPSVYYLPPHAG